MFCLRGWMPVLFFLSDASPLYLLLFLSATYFLNRPCVYCSLLLAVLVFALFDFKADWFEPRHLSATYNPPAAPLDNSSALQSALKNTVSVALSTLNATTGALLGATTEQVGRRLRSRPDWSGLGLEWAKSISGKRELRIPCLNAIIRL